jgi:uncharacterized protein (TIGR02271 family)
MFSASQLSEGMLVYTSDGIPLGQIERVHRDSIAFGGRRYGFSFLDRVEGDRVYLAVAAGGDARERDDQEPPTATAGSVPQASGDLRVPEVEERLAVEKRPIELGEVRVHRYVQEEMQTVPVELQREVVRVERRSVTPRVASAADLAGAFQDQTFRVPVRGEEAVVTKQVVVTREVVIGKERSAERQEVTGTVRRTRVVVDDDRGSERPGVDEQAGRPRPRRLRRPRRWGNSTAPRAQDGAAHQRFSSVTHLTASRRRLRPPLVPPARPPGLVAVA